MATNHYFNHYGTNTADQRLTESLIIESIKVYGIDLYYIARETVNMDTIFGEDRLSQFNDARMIEMYIKNIDGFAGEGTFVSNFGLEVRDQITFTVATRRFQELNFETGSRSVNPQEGDLIYFPLTDAVYEIRRVINDAVFYQVGALQTFDLVCELFEYSDEDFNTGIEAIDDTETDNAYFIEYTYGTGTAATATAELDGTSVGTITVTSGGTAYISAPTVTISDPSSGTTATATANITSSGLVNKITVTSGGTGYSTAPVVTITAPPSSFSVADTITGASSGVTAEIQSINTLETKLKLINNTGTFTNGEIVYNASGSSYLINPSNQTINTQVIANDPYANNVGIETVSDSILDFSEGNPFSEGDL